MTPLSVPIKYGCPHRGQRILNVETTMESIDTTLSRPNTLGQNRARSATGGLPGACHTFGSQ